MSSIVTSRFIKCHDYLKENSYIKSSTKFAEALEITKQALNEILKGRREVSAEILGRAVSTFFFNPDYLLKGEGDYIKNPESDLYFRNNISFIPYRAQAGYLDQFEDEGWLDTLEKFRLPVPQLREGEYRCFEVEGDSMLPHYSDGDFVICSKIDLNYLGNYLKNNMVYIVMTESGIVLKQVTLDSPNSRVVNLVSFNQEYSPQVLRLTHLKELWKVQYKLTSDDLSGGEGNRMGAMTEELASMREMISKLMEAR